MAERYEQDRINSSCAVERARLIRLFVGFTAEEEFALKQGIIHAIFSSEASTRDMIVDIGSVNWPFYIYLRRNKNVLSVNWYIKGTTATAPAVRNKWSIMLDTYLHESNVNFGEPLERDERPLAIRAMRRLFTGCDLTLHTIISAANENDWISREPLQMVRASMNEIRTLEEFGYERQAEAQYPTMQGITPDQYGTVFEYELQVFECWRPYIAPDQYDQHLQTMTLNAVNEWTESECVEFLREPLNRSRFVSKVYQLISRTLCKRLSSLEFPVINEASSMGTQVGCSYSDRRDFGTQFRGSVKLDAQTQTSSIRSVAREAQTERTESVSAGTQSDSSTEYGAVGEVCNLCPLFHVTLRCPFLEYLSADAINQLLTERGLCGLCLEQNGNAFHMCRHAGKSCSLCQGNHYQKTCMMRDQSGRILKRSNLGVLASNQSAIDWLINELPQHIKMLKGLLAGEKKGLIGENQPCSCERRRKQPSPSIRAEPVESEPMESTVEDNRSSNWPNRRAIPSPLQSQIPSGADQAEMELMDTMNEAGPSSERLNYQPIPVPMQFRFPSAPPEAAPAELTAAAGRSAAQPVRHSEPSPPQFRLAGPSAATEQPRAVPPIQRMPPVYNEAAWLTPNATMSEADKAEIVRRFNARALRDYPPAPFPGWGVFWRLVRSNGIPVVREQSLRCRESSERIRQERHGPH